MMKNKDLSNFALILSDVVFIFLINIKMPTIVGILTFTSMIHGMLSRVEHEINFIHSGTDSFAISVKIPMGLLILSF